MNTSLIFSFILFSISSLAGDLYLVCDSIDGNFYQEAPLNAEVVQLQFEDLAVSGGQYLFTVTLTKLKNGYSYLVNKQESKSENSSQIKKTEDVVEDSYTVVTKYFWQQFPVSKNVGCYLID